MLVDVDVADLESLSVLKQVSVNKLWTNTVIIII